MAALWRNVLEVARDAVMAAIVFCLGGCCAATMTRAGPRAVAVGGAGNVQDHDTHIKFYQ